MPQVEFPNEDRTIEVPYGANLRRAALDNDIDIYGFPFNISNCRGHGLCGTCKVRVEPETNLNDRTNAEIRKLKASPLRLACQSTVEGDIACYTQMPLVTTRGVQQEACYIIISRERLEMVQLVDEKKGGQQNVFLSLAEVQEIAREVGARLPGRQLGDSRVRRPPDHAGVLLLIQPLARHPHAPRPACRRRIVQPVGA